MINFPPFVCICAEVCVCLCNVRKIYDIGIRIINSISPFLFFFGVPLAFLLLPVPIVSGAVFTSFSSLFLHDLSDISDILLLFYFMLCFSFGTSLDSADSSSCSLLEIIV